MQEVHCEKEPMHLCSHMKQKDAKQAPCPGNQREGPDAQHFRTREDGEVAYCSRVCLCCEMEAMRFGLTLQQGGSRFF